MFMQSTWMFPILFKVAKMPGMDEGRRLHKYF